MGGVILEKKHISETSAHFTLATLDFMNEDSE